MSDQQPTKPKPPAIDLRDIVKAVIAAAEEDERQERRDARATPPPIPPGAR